MKTIKSFIPKSIFLLIFFSVVFGGNKLTAQNVLDDIYQSEHNPERKPIPYNYLRQADVMWKKRLWRMLDLRQKINLPLYYPTTPIVDSDSINYHYYSLIGLILSSCDLKNIIYNPYCVMYDPDVNVDNRFSIKLTLKEVYEKFGKKPDRKDTTYIENPETGKLEPRYIPFDPPLEEVTRCLMEEIWYFDKQRSMLQVRILGLCPIRMYEKEVTDQGDGMDAGMNDGSTKDLTSKKILWIYYPAFRNIFATHFVFNTKNDAERRTFEDVFSMRRFNSYIFRETNVYDNRRVGAYTKGLDSILESNKVQDWIRDWEHDLWEY